MVLEMGRRLERWCIDHVANKQYDVKILILEIKLLFRSSDVIQTTHGFS
jgi:hypothetical protein